MRNIGDHVDSFFLVTEFSRVTQKLMSNCSRVYIDLIIGFSICSVNNFGNTDLILSLSSWGWQLYLSANTENLDDNLFMALLFVFSHVEDLSAWTKCLRACFGTGPNIKDLLAINNVFMDVLDRTKWHVPNVSTDVIQRTKCLLIIDCL